MHQDLSFVAKTLEGSRRQTDFAVERITTPLALRAHQSTPLEESLNRQLTLAILGAGTAFPVHERDFQRACKTALSTEYTLRDALARELESSPHDLKSSLVSFVTNQPMVRNILGRLHHHQQTGFQLTPGVELGLFGDSRRAGAALLAEFEEIFVTLNKEVPEQISRACKEWGDAQHYARESILAETWLATTQRPEWPRPSMFDRSLRALLEGAPFLSLRSADSEKKAVDWMDAIDTLRHGSSTKMFHAALILKNTSANVEEVLSTFKTLQTEGFSAWAEYVSHGAPMLEEKIVGSLWPDPETRPLKVGFNNLSPSEIMISGAQAVDHWSRYIAKVPLDRVCIHLSAHRLAQNSSQHFDPAAVAMTPLAQHIKELSIHFHGANSRQTHEALAACLKFLEAVARESPWHSNTAPHTVEAHLHYDSQAQRMMLERLLKQIPSTFPWSVSKPSSSIQAGREEATVVFTFPRKNQPGAH